MNVIKEVRVVAPVTTYDASASTLLGQPGPYLNDLDLSIKGLNGMGTTQDQVKVQGLTIQIKYLAP